LENSYFARIFLKYAFAIIALATSPFKYRWGARDNASGNLKYCAISTANFKALVSSDFFDCVNHQNMLGHLETVVTVFGVEYLHGINSVAGFLNLSSHRMRMIVVCYEVLMGLVELEPGEQLEVDKSYATECKDYLCKWCDISRGRLQKNRRTKRKVTVSKSRTASILGFFNSVSSGLDVKSTRLIVKVGAMAITSELKERIVKELLPHVADGMLAPVFPTPSTAKWLKTGPCHDRLFFCNQGNVLSAHMARGLGKLSFEEKLTIDSVELDPTYADWNKVAGKKAAISRSFIYNVVSLVMVAVFMICDEASRFLAHRHLHYAFAPYEYTASKPTPLQVYANDRRSPIYSALVGLSALLFGIASRLILVWRYRGCATLREWFDSYPEDVMLLFRAATSHAASIHRRQREQMRRFRIFTIGDHAMDDNERLQVTTEFTRMSRSQVGDGIPGDLWDSEWADAERIAATAVAVDERRDKGDMVIGSLISKRETLSQSSAFVQVSVGPCETDHAKNNQASQSNKQSVSHYRLAAASVSRQTSERGMPATVERGRMLRMIQDQADDTGSNIGAVVATSGRTSVEERLLTCHRALRATDLHRMDWLCELRAENASVDCCTPEAWAAWRHEWDHLDTDRKERYLEQSNIQRHLCTALATIPVHDKVSCGLFQINRNKMVSTPTPSPTPPPTPPHPQPHPTPNPHPQPHPTPNPTPPHPTPNPTPPPNPHGPCP
jgi:hypothetical protein